MTHHFGLAWRNLRHNRAGTLALFLLSLCAMALMIVASSLGGLLRGGLTGAVEPFELLVGYGGSYQMVLNAVFLQDYPAGSISYRVVEELRRDDRVESAIPLAFGDNYQGYRIVGTDAAIFAHRSAARVGLWLRMAEGRAFRPGTREAVLGARVARECAIRVGDAIRPSHGFIPGADEDHAHPEYRVSGILEECGGPYDGAVLVDLHAVWAAHGIHPDAEERCIPFHRGKHGLDDTHFSENDTAHHQGGEGHRIHAGGQSHTGVCDHGHDHGEGHGHDRPESLRVTAVMVRPVGYAEAYGLAGEFASRREADMVFPAAVVTRLLDILGHAEWLFNAVGIIAGCIAFFTIATGLYWGAAAREREMTILRMLGAENRDIAAMLFFEGLLATAPGLVAGALLGRLFLGLASRALADATSLQGDAGPSFPDLAIFFVLLLAGLIGEGLALRRALRNPKG